MSPPVIRPTATLNVANAACRPIVFHKFKQLRRISGRLLLATRLATAVVLTHFARRLPRCSSRLHQWPPQLRTHLFPRPSQPPLIHGSLLYIKKIVFFGLVHAAFATLEVPLGPFMAIVIRGVGALEVKILVNCGSERSITLQRICASCDVNLLCGLCHWALAM